MSKKFYHNGGKPSNQTEEPVDETTTEETTEEQVEDTTSEAVEETTEDTPVEEKKEVKTPNSENEDEQLISELKIAPIGKDLNSGRVVYPSTPIMRRMKELQEQEGYGVKTDEDLIEYIKTTYRPELLELPQVKYVVDVLTNYVYRMSPQNTIDEISGGEQQVKLARLYDAVLGYEPELSLICLEIIVAVVKENIHLAFSERHALRFINAMKVNTEQSYRFQTLTVLFMELARGTKKENIGDKINPRKLMDFISDKNAKSNLSEFLS